MAALILQPRGLGSGPSPNVVDIPTPPLQRFALFIMFVLPALAVVAVSLRLYTRTTMRTLGVDDLLCTLALITNILVCSSLFMVFKLGYYGWEDDKVPADFNPSAGLWWNYCEQLTYNPTLAFVKCSVLCFLLRIGGHKDSVFRVIWVLMVVTILHAVAVFFATLFQCIPIESNWRPELKQDPDTKCIDDSFHIIQSSINILTDVLILAVPFWLFLHLRMPRRTKLAVLGIFVISVCVPIVAIVRLENLYRLLYHNERTMHHNITYVWTAVETNLAIISCSMPALRSLFSRWYPALSLSGDTSRYAHGREYGSSRRAGGFSEAQPSGARNSHHNRHSNYMLRDLHPSWKQNRTEIRGLSPTGSEEEIMPKTGILRTTDVNVLYELAEQSGERSDTGWNVSKDTRQA